MQRRAALVLLSTFSALALARAEPTLPAEVRAELGPALAQGMARMRYFGLHIYDIRLWTPVALAADEVQDARLALEIEYARSVSGERLAQTSLDEMRRQAPIDADSGVRWLALMRRLFPDVQAGDRITAVQPSPGLSRFYVNGREVGETRDARFTRLFFGIWLSPETSQQSIRQQLLGLAG